MDGEGEKGGWMEDGGERMERARREDAWKMDGGRMEGGGGESGR